MLPLWVADMDFPSPPVVVDALRARVEHGFFGYLAEHTELPEVVADRLNKRYGWRVSPEAVMPLPGVIAGFNLALRALTRPGDGLLIQTPVYPPILRAAGNHGLRREEHALTRGRDGRYTIDRDSFAATISDRTRAFLLCNPHNPVGRVFERRRASRPWPPRACVATSGSSPTRSTASCCSTDASTCRWPRWRPRSSSARSR